MNRIYSLDYIKFFAILGVVIIHTAPVQTDWGYALNVLSRFAVPFFFVTSGFLIAQKLGGGHENDRRVILKYLKKIMLIYVGWTIFYFAYEIAKVYIFSPETLHAYLSERLTFLKLIYYGDASSGYQLWFLPALIWSVSLLYLAHRYFRVEWLLGIGLVLNLVGLLGQGYRGIFPFELMISTRDALFFGVFYVSLGYCIARSKFVSRVKFNKWGIATVIVLLSGLQLLESLLLEHGNYYIATIPLTVAIMLFALNFSEIGKNTFLARVGNKSLGIFVVHVFVINVVELGLLFLDATDLKNSILFQVIYIPSVLIASYVLYELLQSLKSGFKSRRTSKVNISNT